MNNQRILIWTPTGRDAELIQQTLIQNDLEIQICKDTSTLCKEIEEGPGAILLAQEALQPQVVNDLTHCLNLQPPWSDIPVILILSRDKVAQTRLQTSDILLRFTNLTLLERPVYPITLVSLMLAAMRARRRQYDVAKFLNEKVESEQRLEQRVVERTRQLQSANDQVLASLKEKEVLLKEIHHRVKNNLQIISSLLRMQVDKVKNPDAHHIFKTSQDRIQSMALIHEALYQSRDLSNIDFGEYVKKLMSHLRNSYAERPDLVAQDIQIDPEPIGIESAIACGLILNELVTNAFKHAFPQEQKGTLTVHFHRLDENNCKLVIGDNGVGMPETINWENSSSMGFRIVRVLSQQLQAKLEFKSVKGTTFTLILPSIRQESLFQN